MGVRLSDQQLSRAISEPCHSDLMALAERLAEQMVRSWRRGERPLPEEFLACHPELQQQPDAALELISEEICLRQEHGEEIAADELVRRFPQWQPQVQALLDCHDLLATLPAASRFPVEGEQIDGFRLQAELGRGARARVFLATQPALADRAVVLKLAPLADREHLSLARLQHTHIVPLYSVHDIPAQGLRALCMPYFGRATLAGLLETMRDRPSEQRSGRDLLQALQQVESGSPLEVGGPACRFLRETSYVRAVCWIGSCLADALQYAHERGLLHLDLKPSNVLLAADAQPMLLDFHLARAPLPAGSLPSAWLGGTLGYLAPEHQAALAAVADGRAIPTDVDGRADIHALGLLLCEALGGPTSSAGDHSLDALCRNNRQVTPGLAAILGKCLGAEPENRYPTAAALAADLRRHLADLPLCAAANRSLLERWQKWRRRRPFHLPLLGLLLAGVTVACLLFGHLSGQTHKAEAALAEGQEQLQAHDYAQAAETFRHGAALVETLPWNADLVRQLRNHMQLAERGQAALDLHRCCDRIRPLYGAESLSPEQARDVEVQYRSFRQHRGLISQRLGGQLAADLEEQVRTDLLDLAILQANLLIQSVPLDRAPAARREALEVLAQAEAVFGPSCVLCRERQVLALALGLKDLAAKAGRQASVLSPRTAWEHYALGRSYFHAGDLDRAGELMDQALRLEPQALWPNFYKGSCAFRRGQHEDAVVAFSVCVVLSPRTAWCWYNRGLAYLERGRFDLALLDFDRALELDPALARAALSRGVLHYRQQRYPEALADFQQALDRGMDRAVVSYHQALAHLGRQDRAAARDCLQSVLQSDPGHPPARELLNRLEAERKPERK